jgi:hypothetical protein
MMHQNIQIENLGPFAEILNHISYLVAWFRGNFYQSADYERCFTLFITIIFHKQRALL